MKTIAVAYSRVSGQSQVDGDGFERQGIAMLKYAEAHGIEVEEWFEERGVSGTTEWDARPAWIIMMERVVARGVRCILIERLDRLARDLMVQEHIIADRRLRGIELISTTEPDLCSTDPTRVLMRQIMGAIAEFDRQMIVLKLRSARNRKKAATGRCEGNKPFGFYPEEVKSLERIRELKRQGHHYMEITRRLNAEGVPTRMIFKTRANLTPSGRQWHPMAVSRIVDRMEQR